MIGLLYESDEWSDYKLADELRALGCPVEMIDLAHEDVDRALACEMLVSRIFASAVFRGHEAAHERMARLVPAAEARGITLVNSGRAHFYEISKRASTEALGRAWIDVPRVQACGLPRDLDAGSFAYPCVIKPDCGGRTTYTAIARSRADADAFLAQAPGIAFIVEDYVEPERGFITRVEVVEGSCALIVKRSVTEGGLSAYHLGSSYELYPECPRDLRAAVERAARELGIAFGSFDVIESGPRAFIIDANSVSNVSEDNTETFRYDLMRAHAEGMARIWRGLRRGSVPARL